MAGRVLAPGVPDPGVDPRLVVRDPMLDAIAQPARDGGRILDERLSCRARGPAPCILELLRCVPVEKRRERLDVAREQLVDEAVVEVEACLVDRAAPGREDARPRDREPKRVQTELAHERDVVAVAVVEVARDLTRIAVANFPWRRAEPVPDALAASILVRRTFDLVRRRRGTPKEVEW